MSASASILVLCSRLELTRAPSIVTAAPVASATTLAVDARALWTPEESAATESVQTRDGAVDASDEVKSAETVVLAPV